MEDKSLSLSSYQLEVLATLIVDKLAGPFSAHIGARFEPTLTATMLHAVEYQLNNERLVKELTKKISDKVLIALTAHFAERESRLEVLFAQRVLDYLIQVTGNKA